MAGTTFFTFRTHIPGAHSSRKRNWRSNWWEYLNVTKRNKVFVSRSFTTFTDFPTTFLKDVRLSYLNYFFLHLVYSPLFRFSLLIYCFFEGCQTEFCYCVSLIAHFFRISLLNTTFLKDARLSRPQKVFLYLAYLQLFRIPLLTYNFIEGGQAELTQKMCSLVTQLTPDRGYDYGLDFYRSTVWIQRSVFIF